MSIDTPEAVSTFIEGSRQSLNHLKLAALSQIQEAIIRRKDLAEEETILRQEWKEAIIDFTHRINYELISDPMIEAIQMLTPRLGEISQHDLYGIVELFKDLCKKYSGAKRLPATFLPIYENWLQRALRINSALLAKRFEATGSSKIAEAYQVWAERQSDREDVMPDVFGEQVAYVFFVRLLLVRVLEDKHILRPRLASDGGFLDWSQYISRHFKELDSIGILNETFCSILSRKASSYYLHFFQQAVFDWFNPDDFLLIETLEFLCRYNFRDINSDIIGFTYQSYIERNARDRKGHFLTGQELVEYMLDLLDYTGTQIIGRRILDPACGSGSFLVHAARRYRRALITYQCNLRGLPDREESISADYELCNEFARLYLDHLTSLFFGMELNPFACYLAEMNLLIQALNDLFVLQQSGDVQPIERFQIYNTDSLVLPREVLDKTSLTGEMNRISIPDRLSDRLTDEAYAIKGALEPYAEGFFYVVSNPPYVSSKQEVLDTQRFREADFYQSILSGDTNLYLLFLRLGLHYISEYGQMIYIVPLTILGDRSGNAARKLLKTPPFSLLKVIRFYRGDILFPKVDQAVAIIQVERSFDSASSILIGGGNTISEAKTNQFRVPSADVVEVVPQNSIWHGSWLVAPNKEALEVWLCVKQVSNNLTNTLGSLIDATFSRKQGDVNATHLNPLRLGANGGSFTGGAVAVYKGEDVKSFAPLSSSPPEWAKPLKSDNGSKVSRDTLRTSEMLERIQQLVGIERGIVLREVARLNTRERLIATWFERSANKPIAFTHKLWRMVLKSDATEEYGKALLAIINSNVTSYLINLFSTNNDVSKDDLSRVPIPDPQNLPITQLAKLVDEILNERIKLSENFVEKYKALLPEFDDGKVYIPPSTVLTVSRMPKLTLQALVGRGEVKNNGSANGRIESLRKGKLIKCILDPANPNSTALTNILDLFLSEPGKEKDTWFQAQSWQLPDIRAAKDWLDRYHIVVQEAQTSWNRFVSLQKQIDDLVASWYGFNVSQRLAVSVGLPWARRQRDNNIQDRPDRIDLSTSSGQLVVSITNTPIGITKRVPVKSSQIYSIGYDKDAGTLEVEFISGDIWQYLAVPLDIYQKLETASSKGKYYLQKIRGKYDSHKL